MFNTKVSGTIFAIISHFLTFFWSQKLYSIDNVANIKIGFEQYSCFFVENSFFQSSFCHSDHGFSRRHTLHRTHPKVFIHRDIYRCNCISNTFFKTNIS